MEVLLEVVWQLQVVTNCDIAASSLIVEEAGGKVTDFYGNRQRYDQDINGAIISNGTSHDEVLEYVKKYVK